MATEKTRAALLADIATFWPDNTSGDISPADLRGRLEDIIESNRIAHALIVGDVPAATVIGSPGTFVKAAGTTLLVNGAFGFSMPSNFQVQYSRLETRPIISIISFTVETSVNNTVATFAIKKGGTLLPTSELNRASIEFRTTNKPEHIALMVDTAWPNGGDLEFFMTADRVTNITITGVNWVNWDIHD